MKKVEHPKMMLVVRRAQVRLLRIVLKLGRTASEILSDFQIFITESALPIPIRLKIIVQFT